MQQVYGALNSHKRMITRARSREQVRNFHCQERIDSDCLLQAQMDPGGWHE